MKKMNFSILDKYDFLNILEQKRNEHFEVTYDAINYYSQYFSIYSEENGWEKQTWKRQRNQMSSSGCWLQKMSGKPTIDIVGDILTSVSAFNGLEKNCLELHALFVRVYHTIGNCIPWPEGGNLGGKPWKKGGSPDNYYRKLMICYNLMNQENKEHDTECVRHRIENKKTLGGLCFSSIQYWIDEIWKDKTWEDFVKINHLHDMVDENLHPIKFGLCGERVEQEKVKDIYLENIRMIICRGYRITHGGNLDSKIIKEIYEQLGLER